MLRDKRRSKTAKLVASELYAAAVSRARSPEFHVQFHVPDTIDGRFDLLVLHLCLVLERLKQEGAIGVTVTSALVDLSFAAFDEALRELGVSDMGMARRIKAMADAFYGRLEAYSAAENTEADLAAAIWRNIYRSDARRKAEAAALALYTIAARHFLLAMARETLLDGQAGFGPMPEMSER